MRTLKGVIRSSLVQGRGKEIRENMYKENVISATPDGAKLRVTECTSLGEMSCYFYLLPIFVL